VLYAFGSVSYLVTEGPPPDHIVVLPSGKRLLVTASRPLSGTGGEYIGELCGNPDPGDIRVSMFSGEIHMILRPEDIVRRFEEAIRRGHAVRE